MRNVTVVVAAIVMLLGMWSGGAVGQVGQGETTKAPTTRMKLSEKSSDLNQMFLQAARDGDTKRAQELLAEGADIEAVDSSLGGTALIWAAARGHKDVVVLLLEHGADPMARSKEGVSAGMVAIEQKHPEIAAMIQARVKPDDRAAARPRGTGPTDSSSRRLEQELFRATQGGDEARVRELISRGANPNIRHETGLTPLALSCLTFRTIYGA